MINGIKTGVVADGEICPGVTWEDHAESVAMFYYGTEFTSEQLEDVMNSIDGDPDAE